MILTPAQAKLKNSLHKNSNVNKSDNHDFEQLLAVNNSSPINLTNNINDSFGDIRNSLAMINKKEKTMHRRNNTIGGLQKYTVSDLALGTLD